MSVGGDLEAEVDFREKSSNKGKAPVKSSAEWRDEGNKTLFAEAIALAQSQKVMSMIPDATFITDTAHNEDDEKVLKIADKVMDQVADELDLQTSAEILYFQDKTNLQPSRFDGGEEGEQRKVPSQVPPGLFSGPGRTMADPSTLQTHPVAIKTAMRALHFAINNPLTNYNEVPQKGGLPPHDYVRPTASTTNRQMPRVKPSMKEPSNIVKIKNKAKRGLTEPSLVAIERRKERGRTLQQIEDVLDDLNSNVDDLVLKGPNAAGYSKDTVNLMKTFARPKTGLKGLVQMVEEVVNDLDA